MLTTSAGHLNQAGHEGQAYAFAEADAAQLDQNHDAVLPEPDVDEMAEELWKTKTKVINTFINNPANGDKKTEKEPSDASSGTPLPD